MKAVNLLPPELRSRVPGDGDVRVAYGVFAGLTVLLLMVVLTISYSNKATTLNDETASLQAEAARYQTQAKPVESFNDFAELTKSRTLLVGGLAASRFPWGQALYNLSRALPKDVTLNTIKASTTSAASAAPAVAGAAEVPDEASLDLTGCTSGWIGYSRLTVWLKNMPGVKDVASAQSAVSGPKAADADASTNRSENCGPSPLDFSVKVTYRARAVNLLGLPKVESATPAGASGAVGATPTTGSPAASTTASGGQ